MHTAIINLKFQFLIGKVQQKKILWEAKYEQSKVFQFLIGKVQPWWKCLTRCLMTQTFQFLIGKVQQD